MNRRRFLGALGIGAATLSLSACGDNGEIPLLESLTERKPNEDLVRIYAEYKKLADAGDLNRFQQPFIEGQMGLVEDEWHRLCGTDSDGNQPQSCVDLANAGEVQVPKNFTAVDLQEDLLEVASGVAKKNTESPDAGLLIGLAASLGGLTAGPKYEDLVDLRPKSITEEMEKVHSTAQGVIFACGIATAVDDGTNREVILNTANALRALRNAIEEAATELEFELDAAPAGYFPTDGQKLPAVPSDVLPYMQKITHTVVNALYIGATTAESSEDTRFCGTWCASIALHEIAQERAAVTNPLLKLVRGNASED